MPTPRRLPYFTVARSEEQARCILAVMRGVIGRWVARRKCGFRRLLPMYVLAVMDVVVATSEFVHAVGAARGRLSASSLPRLRLAKARLPPRLYAELRKMAALRGVSVSEVIRSALRWYVDVYETQVHDSG